MAVKHSSLLNLAVVMFFIVVSVMAAQAQSSDEQSLGDVARTQRSKNSGSTVIDEDEMVRRGFAHPAVKVPFDCDAECMKQAKPLAYWNFRDATEKQWQDAFAVAIPELAQGDWGQRLSEIREVMCRNPGDPDSTRLKTLEDEMFSKLRFETRSKNIDEKALANPNDAAGAEALRQLRVEDLKTGILEAKVQSIQQSCPSPAKAPGK
jgi:hypothetical protein